MAGTIIQFDHVCKFFDEHPVLLDFSLSIEKGTFLTVIGRSGCGKTTALRLVNGLISADSGRVLVMEEGKATQFDPPSALMASPATPFVAQLVRRSRDFVPRQ